MSTDQDDKFIAHYSQGGLKDRVYSAWLSTDLPRYFKRRRLQLIDEKLNGILAAQQGKRILEIGCGSGRDFVKFLDGHNLDIYGLDIFDTKLRQGNLTFIEGDAEKTDFPDKYFDACVSIGVLEHIEPIDKLDRVIQEIDRISKSYCIVIPSISTLIEPHFWKPLWQLRAPTQERPGTYYYGDETWRNFQGFKDAKLARHYYLPPLISNLYIYKA